MVHQYLSFNKSIGINKNILTSTSLRSNNIDNVQEIKILNMLDPHNMFLNIEDFNNNNQTNMNILEYNALKCCIPSSWNFFVYVVTT